MIPSKTVGLKKLLVATLSMLLIVLAGAACSVGTNTAQDDPAETVSQAGDSTSANGDSASDDSIVTTTENSSPEIGSSEETTLSVEQTVLEELPEVTAAQGDSQPPALTSLQQPEIERFVSEVFSDTDAMWAESFRQTGLTYMSPSLEFVYEPIDTACGPVDAMTGPIYCPPIQTIYYTVDMTIPVPNQSSQDGSATENQYYLDDFGDFAVAYVIAYEIGHHVQELMGILMAKQDKRLLNIQTELQADCLAGVWANTTYYRGMLEEGDIEEGLLLAENIADRPGTAVEDPGAHGSAEQRMDWFRYGYDTGDGSKCTTY